MKSVAIIGGGVAGILALKQTLRYPRMRPVLYETTQRIGGVWVYDGKDTIRVGDDYENSPVSVYENLVTNQARQVMEFPDFKHEDEKLPSYLTHEMVLKYLEGYCTHFELKKCIKFGYKVQHVAPVPRKDAAPDDVRWRLDVLNVAKNELISEMFDAVLVCNGHYTKPNIPVIPGSQYFDGKIIHSRSYRRPSDFVDENVLVIGAGASGVDIALDVATSAREVYLSNRGQPLKSRLPQNIHEVPVVLCFNEEGCSVTLVDGRRVVSNSVIYATGFKYDFPFLDKTCGITVEHNHVNPLYKHIVNIEHPSMLFIGLPQRIPLFKIFHLQATFAAKVLSDDSVLPSKAKMLTHEAFDGRARADQPRHYAHHIGNSLLQGYIDYLAEAGDTEKAPENVINIYKLAVEQLVTNATGFKTENYVLGEDGAYYVE